MWIPFNKPSVSDRELRYLAEAIAGRHLSGDGPFTKRCSAWLQARTGAARALLTHSGTAALEMAALLLDIRPGDEVVMPSFTFSSTANAFVLRGGVPVFVDIDEETLNIDVAAAAAAITDRTRVIVPVHYAGFGCDMDALMAVATTHGLAVVEDAAQGLLARYRGRPLGGIGHLAALSFHETKNVIAGEGGALLVNEPKLVERAEIIREKGTNRSQFFRGEVDKYTWVDLGSSYLPSELTAAFLLAQCERADEMRERRLAVWSHYHEGFEPLERAGRVRRPVVPPDCEGNGHLYYLRLSGLDERSRVLQRLKEFGVNAVFHYVPLHSSPAGRAFGRSVGPLCVTDRVSDSLIRLPLWPDMTDADAEQVVQSVTRALEG